MKLSFYFEGFVSPRNVKTDLYRKLVEPFVHKTCHLCCSYPQRVSKLKATVRYMFHNPEDVRWFKVCKIVDFSIFLFVMIFTFNKFPGPIVAC